MKKRTKTIILTITFIQLAIIAALTILPPLARALPGEYRVRIAHYALGDALLDIGATPLPTALPAPNRAITPVRITIPAITAVTPTPQPTETPQPTVEIEAELETAVTPFPTTEPTNTPEPTAAATAMPLPPQARIDGLEIIAQGFNNCGPANLTINLTFYGDTTTQETAAAFLKPNREDRNVSPWQIVDYVNEQSTMRAFIGSGGTLELLKRLIANGFPVVIEKGYELPSEGWLGHYLTLFAYDDAQQEMLSMDTNLGPWDNSGRVDSYEDIEYYWQQFNYTFYVVYPPSQEQIVYDLLGEEMLDTAVMWQNAAEIAQADIDQNPENAFAWFNLGSSLTRLGEMTGEAAFYENGANAFDQARVLGIPPRIVWYQFRPYIAYMKVGRYQDMLDLAEATLATQGGQNVEETYLYKGHALAFTGNGAGAVEAYQEALRLNENFYPAQWALDAIVGNG
ncbi:MAG: C39 family peptidase [Ardenticatenaceae bacterium]|nr:C39 family peptidase [Ardenticatenaceae bacterium]